MSKFVLELFINGTGAYPNESKLSDTFYLPSNIVYMYVCICQILVHEVRQQIRNKQNPWMRRIAKKTQSEDTQIEIHTI